MALRKYQSFENACNGRLRKASGVQQWTDCVGLQLCERVSQPVSALTALSAAELHLERERDENTSQSASPVIIMADFDAIYEDQDENSSILEAPDINLVPDPVIIRGAGNITV